MTISGDPQFMSHEARLDEIRRLEWELASARNVLEKSGETILQYSNGIAEIRTANNRLEAQAAAMREVLEKLFRRYPERPELSSAEYDMIRSSLSPDAGAKVLRVVETARALDAGLHAKYLDVRLDKPLWAMRQALADLKGRGP